MGSGTGYYWEFVNRQFRRLPWCDHLELLRLARSAAIERLNAEIERTGNTDGRVCSRELAAAIQYFRNADKAYSDALSVPPQP